MTRERSSFGTPDATADWEALARYLADESPAEEAQAIRRWLEAHPADDTLLRALDNAIDRAAPSLRAAEVRGADIDAALARATARLAPAGTRAPDRAPWWRGSVVRVAATLALVAGSVLLWRTTQRGSDAAAPASARTYVTRVGQRDSVRLDDGSRIVLGPASRLVVAANYGEPGREVSLDGEAYFEVAHDDAHAFTVRAGGAIIRDVGTTFTVRTDDGERVRVAVSAGAVLLAPDTGPADRGVVLHPGDVGVLRADGGIAAARGTATADEAAWRSGRVVFRDASLDHVRAELRRWYGLELRVADSAIAGRHLTASFEGDSASAVLRVLELALGARIERRGDTVVVRAASPVR